MKLSIKSCVRLFLRKKELASAILWYLFAGGGKNAIMSLFRFVNSDTAVSFNSNAQLGKTFNPPKILTQETLWSNSPILVYLSLYIV